MRISDWISDVCSSDLIDLNLLLTGGAIAVLLFMSAFFSGSETALTAASRARMHQLENEGESRAAAVNRLRDDKERLIGAVLLGNNSSDKRRVGKEGVSTCRSWGSPDS